MNHRYGAAASAIYRCLGGRLSGNSNFEIFKTNEKKKLNRKNLEI